MKSKLTESQLAWKRHVEAQEKAMNIRHYREGWQMHLQGKPYSKCITKRMGLGWQARQAATEHPFVIFGLKAVVQQAEGEKVSA